MFYALLVLLLTSCSFMRQHSVPEYTHNSQTIPLSVNAVKVTINDTTSTCENSGFAGALRQWGQKRFKPMAKTGTLEVVVTTEPIADCLSDEGITNRTIVISVRIHGSEFYETARLQIKAYRTNNKFGSEPPEKGSEVWSEYMSNFINSIDAQILQGLRHYTPKLLSPAHRGSKF